MRAQRQDTARRARSSRAAAAAAAAAAATAGNITASGIGGTVAAIGGNSIGVGGGSAFQPTRPEVMLDPTSSTTRSVRISLCLPVCHKVRVFWWIELLILRDILSIITICSYPRDCRFLTV